ncbi:MAG: hypothetical protein KI790_18375 [Cyclobacteriaceae bacterium]|nr:hypothetical protein [Cyclobacteriaceae bacterium HetDA_MAG_MS6]
MNKLNEQYFETRKKHKESYRKSPVWVTLILIAISTSIYLYSNRDYIFNKPTTTPEQLLSELSQYSEEPLIFEDILFSVQLPTGYWYKTLDNKSRLFAISVSDDSTLVTSLLVKVEPRSTIRTNLIEQWEHVLNKGKEDKFRFNLISIDSLDGRTERALTEVDRDTSTFRGLTEIMSTESNIYILQGVTNEPNWQVDNSEIAKFIDSFKPKTGI